MKKIISIITVLLLLFSLTSCSERAWIFMDDNKKLDKTFGKVIEAIKEKDSSKLINLLSDNVKEKDGISQSATDFINYIQGDILSFTSAKEGGKRGSKEVTGGKTITSSNTAFTVNTSTHTYHFYMDQCFRDDFDPGNIGVVLITVIDSENWKSEYSYKSDGAFDHGVYIDDGKWKR